MPDSMLYVTQAVDQIKTLVETVELVANKRVFYVYSEDDLLNETKLRQMPCVGIMYGGLRAVPDPTRKGLSTVLRVVLVVIAETKNIGALDKKEYVVSVLDQIRDAIKGKRSPTGHFWQFMGENPAPMLGNRIVYLQNWQTAAIVA